MEEEYVDDVVQILKAGQGQKYSGKELARKIDRNRYREDPNWLRKTLDELVNRKVIEVDESHHFFIEKE